MIKVKITHPIMTMSGRFEAGQIVEVTDTLGKDWIEANKAIEVIGEVIEVAAIADPEPLFIEAPKKKVKHG